MTKNSAGFTLLELLVALAVFAVLSSMAYGGLSSVLRARDGTQIQAQRLAALQTAFGWFEKDLDQVTARGVRVPYGERARPLQAARAQDYSLELTRAGWSNPFPSAERQRSYLQRVAYGLKEKQLVRRYWFDLDRDYDSPSFETVLLDGVTALDLRFVGGNLQYETSWPPLEGGDALPQAVEVTLEVDGVGKITRLFRLPEGLPEKKTNPP